MIDRDTQFDKVLMGAPIGVATAAVAYGGGHWVLVSMLGLVSVLIMSSACIDLWKAGSHGYAAFGMALVVVPVGFAGMVLADRDSQGGQLIGSVSQEPSAIALDRAGGLGGNAPQNSIATKGETDLTAFAEVAQVLKAAKTGDTTPEGKYARQKLATWEATGVKDFSAIDPATGRPKLSASRWDALAKARKSFEEKLATQGRNALLTPDEAAWAAHSLGAGAE